MDRALTWDTTTHMHRQTILHTYGVILAHRERNTKTHMHTEGHSKSGALQAHLQVLNGRVLVCIDFGHVDLATRRIVQHAAATHSERLARPRALVRLDVGRGCVACVVLAQLERLSLARTRTHTNKNSLLKSQLMILASFQHENERDWPLRDAPGPVDSCDN